MDSSRKIDTKHGIESSWGLLGVEIEAFYHKKDAPGAGVVVCLNKTSGGPKGVELRPVYYIYQIFANID